MLAYYRDFVERGGGDPALRSDLAEASFRVALITMDLGDKRDALAALEHARDLYEAVLRDRPADQDVRRRLAVCYDKIGSALGALGRTPEALLAHARECDLNRQIVAAAPEDLGTRRFLGTSLGMLANAYSMQSDGPRSQQYYREARDQFRELLRRDPTNRIVMGDLAMTLNNMSLGGTPSPDQIALLTEALALHEALLASEKGPGVFHRRNIARTRFNLGIINKELGRLDEALPLAKSARDSLRRVVLDAPENITYRGDLAAACIELAGLLALQGRPDEAIDAGKEGIAILEDLARVDPENMTYRGFLANVLVIVADAHESLGHTEVSLRHRRGRLAILERISTSRPDDPRTRDDIAAERLAIERLVGEAVPNKPQSGSSR